MKFPTFHGASRGPRWPLVALLGATLLLGGCAGLRVVDSEVRSFAQWPAGQPQPGATYRFERLPSQQSFGERQAQVEKIARAALEQVGLRLDERSPRYLVQLGVRAEREARSAWDDPFPVFGMPGRDYVVTGNGQLIWVPPLMRTDSPWYKRQVTLLIRDTGSGQVVYETHALHEGRWADGDALLPAMFEAALAGFPTPPQGPRRVDVTVRPAQKAAPAPAAPAAATPAPTPAPTR